MMTFIAPHYNKAKSNALISFFKKDHYLVKTPWWLKKIYTGCVWDMKPEDKTLYLSFDDGPHPTITPFVLQLLKQYNAKATFFCIGENVVKYPGIYRQIIEEGHATGNHTYHHLNGWKTGDNEYLANIKEAGQYISSNLFRPPYGRIKKSQIRLLKKESGQMKIVMWNILAGDWVPGLTPERCFDRIKRKISNADIIAFHDNDKSWPRLEYCLPKTLELFTEKGFSFKAIQINSD
jgi:peptidoglycan/xylan/chitin deacetylase (PgdA/CDA1 family)